MLARRFRMRQEDAKEKMKVVASTTHFLLRYTTHQKPLFAVVVPKTITKTAILRNKIRREVYKSLAIQLKELKIPEGKWIVTLKHTFKKGSVDNNHKELLNLFSHINTPHVINK